MVDGGVSNAHRTACNGCRTNRATFGPVPEFALFHSSTPLSKIGRLVGSEPRLGLGRAFGAALGTWSGRVHASVAALRPQALSRPSGARPSLAWCTRSPHPPWVRRRRRTSCFVSFQRPHPQRTFSTLAVRPPHLPCMRPIGAGTRLPPLRSGRQTARVRAEIVLDSHDSPAPQLSGSPAPSSPHLFLTTRACFPLPRRPLSGYAVGWSPHGRDGTPVRSYSLPPEEGRKLGALGLVPISRRRTNAGGSPVTILSEDGGKPTSLGPRCAGEGRFNP